MEAAKRLRAKVQAGQITTGVLATDRLWPQLVEFLQKAGIDYLIADQEHGVHTAIRWWLRCVPWEGRWGFPC
jgi:2-keto-3-deoxy-L-rhamnonate aldolase RhmA